MASNRQIPIERITVKQSEFACNKITYGKLTENKQYGFTKVYLNYNKSAFIIESDESDVMFCKKHVSDEGIVSYNLGVKCTGLEKLIDKEINERIISDAVENSDKWFGEEKDEEVIRDIFRSPFIPKNGDYESTVMFKINNYSLDKLIRNKPDVKEIETVLTRDSKIKLGFVLPSVTIKENSLRLNGEVLVVKLIKQADPISIKAIKLSDYNESKVKLSDLIKTDKGGKKTMPSYNGNKLSLDLKDVRLIYTSNGILANKFNEDDADRYCLTMSLADEIGDLFKGLDLKFKKLLFDNHMEYYGKKKSMKLIESSFRSQCYYSKKTLEKIKKGEEPEYPPTLSLELPYYNDKATYKVFQVVKDKDGNVIMEDRDGVEVKKIEPFEGDFDEFIKSNSKPVDLIIKCRHIWFGTKASVKWDVVRVVIDSDVEKKEFKFSDDFDEQEADNVDDDDDEPDEDEENDNDSTEDSAESDSD